MTSISLIEYLQGAPVPTIVLILKATGLILVAATLALMLRRASAEARHQIWLVAMIGLMLLPIFAIWSPLPIRMLPDSFGTTAGATPPPVLGPAATTNITNPAALTSDTPAPAANIPNITTDPGAGTSLSASITRSLRRFSLSQLLLTLWLVVALLLFAKLGHGWYQVRRIVRRALALNQAEWTSPLYEIADRLELGQAPQLVRSADVEMPFACGVLHSTIVLPAESDHWTAERRSAVLIHELGHIKRHDLLGHTLGRLVCTLYWFHPMAWAAARHLRDESERACDDLALTFGARPSEYAEHLLDIVIGVRNHAAPSVALALAHRREFEGRMLAILDPHLHRSSPGRWQRVTVMGSLAVFALILAAAAPAMAPAAMPPAAPVPAIVDQEPASIADPASQATPEKAPHGAERAIARQLARHASDSLQLQLSEQGVLMNLGDVKIAIGAGGVSLNRHSRHASDDDTTWLVDDDDPAAALAKVLHSDSSAAVRRVAAWGLQQYLDNPVAATAVTDALAKDSDADVRKMSAWALADADGKVGLTALLGALEHDKSDAVREMAAWGLGERSESSTADEMGKQMLSEHSAIVRATLAWALGQMDLNRAPKGLIGALDDTTDDVRFKAAWALSQIGDSLALPALRRAITHEHHPGAQRAELRALMTSGEAPEAFASLLSSTQPGVRVIAVRAMAGSIDPGPWPWPWPRPIPIP